MMDDKHEVECECGKECVTKRNSHKRQQRFRLADVLPVMLILAILIWLVGVLAV